MTPCTLCGAVQDSVSLTPLGPPSARSSDGFTSIFDVAELADGRVLLTDNRERRLAIVDLDAGTVHQIGREGEGPGEYRSVHTILPQPSGAFLVYDGSLRRFAVVSAHGGMDGTQPLNRPPLSGFSAPRGPDAEGYVYLSHREIGPGGLSPRATLYRWHPQKEELIQVATISNYAPGQEGRSFVPMPREDAWTFLADGSVGLLVAEDYHMEWSGGLEGSAVGPPIPYPRHRVGEEEREAWLNDLFSRPPAGSSRMSGESGTSSRRRSSVDPHRFPEFIPPFDGGFVPTAPWGETWVKVDVLSDSDRSVFDVLNRRGQLVRRVSVEGAARLVGFGTDVVYLARKDAYDMEWLERFPVR